MIGAGPHDQGRARLLMMLVGLVPGIILFAWQLAASGPLEHVRAPFAVGATPERARRLPARAPNVRDPSALPSALHHGLGLRGPREPPELPTRDCALCQRVLYVDALSLGRGWAEQLAPIMRSARFDAVALCNVVLASGGGGVRAEVELAKAASQWWPDAGAAHFAPSRSGGVMLALVARGAVRMTASRRAGSSGGLLCAVTSGLRVCILSAHVGADAERAEQRESARRSADADAASLVADARALGGGVPTLLLGELNGTARVVSGVRTSWADAVAPAGFGRVRAAAQLDLVGARGANDAHRSARAQPRAAVPANTVVADAHALVNGALVHAADACRLATLRARAREPDPEAPSGAGASLNFAPVEAGWRPDQPRPVVVHVCRKRLMLRVARASSPTSSPRGAGQPRLPFVFRPPVSRPRKPARLPARRVVPPPPWPPDVKLTDEEAAVLQRGLDALFPRVRVRAPPKGAPPNAPATLERRSECASLRDVPGLANAARMLGSERHVRMCQNISTVLANLARRGPTATPPARLRSCAVVGGSGALASHPHGRLIDAHEHVFRVNGCPVRGFEARVGSRTSVRFVNSPQTQRWVRSAMSDEGLSAELLDARLALMWTDRQARLDMLARKAAAIGATVRFRWLRAEFRAKCINPLWLRADRTRHEKSNGVRGLEITFGFEALMHALYSCETVSVFGFFLDAADMAVRTNAPTRMRYPYHYWERVTYDKSAKDPYRPWTYAFHDFALEEEKMREMRRACLIERYVTDVPGALPGVDARAGANASRSPSSSKPAAAVHRRRRASDVSADWGTASLSSF
ncbi:hypothetical protein KFE25_002158 [Diacronema lutheri]|uniref:Uncharacterized protein n=3 Tax=Diacronema lutheri TaxID=2081491 RepID=A0A8J6C9D7_DIALT|nr:hypothetical protein KFE25_002158 [Diacronema lutheri]